MKRIGNLYSTICSPENLRLADAIAQKGKSKQPGVIAHKANAEANLQALHELLINHAFETSPYTVFTIYEPKERQIYRLPYYPDRIVHHAIMNVLEPVFVSMFTADTYSCIKGKGIHAAVVKLKAALQDVAGTQYCLKLDIQKFYPSVDHAILKQLLRRKIKDKALLQLLDGIIDSADGLPIGNYLSQYFANLYLTGFDHWLKEQKGVKYYYRYADDIVILAPDKPYLHQLRADIQAYLHNHLKLTIKHNYQVFPVAARGIDFVGYVFRHGYTRMRKRIKQNLCRAVAKGAKQATLASYTGWAKHCDSRHLLKKLLPNHGNETFQRIQDRGRRGALYRRKDRYRQGIQRSDRGARLQDKTIAIHGAVPVATDKACGRDAGIVQRIEKADSTDRQYQQGRFAF